MTEQTDETKIVTSNNGMSGEWEAGAVFRLWSSYVSCKSSLWMKWMNKFICEQSQEEIGHGRGGTLDKHSSKSMLHVWPYYINLSFCFYN